jgi:hypothetical protein
MAEDTTIQILTLFEHLERPQKKDLAGLLNTIYGPGPHHEALLRRIKGLICTARSDVETMVVDWKAVCDAICTYIDNELDIGKAKEYDEAD